MTWLGKFWSNESGASAALYALALPALIGAVGIGFDYARVASMDTELQNAADQAALAGATQLDQQANSIVRATAAARNGLVTNSTLFANDNNTNGTTVTVGDVGTGVFFYQTLADAEAGTNAIDPTASGADALARFIRVKVDTRKANYALTPVVGAFSGSLDAEAVAGIGSAVCRIPPLMICNPDEPSTNTNENFDFNANAYIGKGLLVVQQGKWEPGAFGFLDLGNGATGVEQGLAWVSPTGDCVPVNGPDVIDLDVDVDIEPGLKASTIDAINTRFDIYDSCPAGGPCPASINSIKDVVHPTSLTANKACTFGTNGETDGWQEVPAAGRYKPTSDLALGTAVTPNPMGHPRDICQSLGAGFNTCTRFGDGYWDRNAYFRSRYLRTSGPNAGTRWTQADWIANTGLSLGTGARPSTPTRYQVYLWEIRNRGTVVDGVTVLGNQAVGTVNNNAQPVCSPHKSYGTGTVPATGVADRRRMSVAVINCKAEDVNGKSGPYKIRKFVDIFLVQPSLNRDNGLNGANRRVLSSKTDMYVEIIGESTDTSSGTVAGAVIRRDVPYLIK